MSPKHIALISTGGTIEKTYDELRGVLENRFSVLDVMLDMLVLNGIIIERIKLMNKDSLDMVTDDHQQIAKVTVDAASNHDGIVIVHGTDRLATTGDVTYELLAKSGGARVPVVLTGAMRPYVMRTTDAVQNLTEALLAVQLLQPGVYVAMHNMVLRFPGVVKDKERGTFIRKDDVSPT